jgi:hypothetical protein
VRTDEVVAMYVKEGAKHAKEGDMTLKFTKDRQEVFKKKRT